MGRASVLMGTPQYSLEINMYFSQLYSTSVSDVKHDHMIICELLTCQDFALKLCYELGRKCSRNINAHISV